MLARAQACAFGCGLNALLGCSRLHLRHIQQLPHARRIVGRFLGLGREALFVRRPSARTILLPAGAVVP